jgi:hypothetical protein
MYGGGLLALCMGFAEPAVFLAYTMEVPAPEYHDFGENVSTSHNVEHFQEPGRISCMVKQ